MHVYIQSQFTDISVSDKIGLTGRNKMRTDNSHMLFSMEMGAFHHPEYLTKQQGKDKLKGFHSCRYKCNLFAHCLYFTLMCVYMYVCTVAKIIQCIKDLNLEMNVHELLYFPVNYNTAVKSVGINCILSENILSQSKFGERRNHVRMLIK